jgi:hypothetical protein
MRKGTSSACGSGVISRKPMAVIAAACSCPMEILRSISPSLPCVPPA